MAEALLKVTNVVKTFGGLTAVDGVSLDVPEGGFVGLVGPNGCGKTTLLSTIFGVQKPDSGSITFNGVEISGREPHDNFARGMVNAFQFPRLFFKLSVLDNMIIAARQNSGDGYFNTLFRRKRWQEDEKRIADRAHEILDLLELTRLAFTPAGSLSGGQKKLVEIGRSLMAEPKLLLLDEPAAGVNPVLGEKIFQKLETFRQNGMSFLVIEHRLELLMAHTSWVYVMDRGKIALEGKPEDVVNNRKFYEVYIGEGGDAGDADLCR